MTFLLKVARAEGSLPSGRETMFEARGRGGVPVPARAGIYVHIPYCRVHCPYCNFSVVVDSPGQPHAPYLQALTRSFREDPPPFSPRTLYIGGGTPSRLKLEEICALFQELRSLFLEPPLEVTFEVNPEDLNEALLKTLRAWGVTRLSLGLQRCREEELKFLGRARSARALPRLGELLQLWCDRGGSASVDILYGLPGETEKELGELLAFVKILPVQHLSAYALTLEPGTPFHRLAVRNPERFPDGDHLAHLYEFLLCELEGWGWYSYEVSNFASSPEYFSLHNLIYWQYGMYMGYGLYAASFCQEQGRWQRFRRRGELPLYLRDPGARTEVEELTPAKILLERLFLGLRSMVGIPALLWEEAKHQEPNLARLEEEGVVVGEEGRVCLTPKSRFLSDEIALRLYRVLEPQASFLIKFF